MIIIPTSEELNHVIVAGVLSPGRAQITGAGIVYKWDVREGYGLSGAVTVFKGRGLCRPTLTITLWEPEHFVQWASFAKLLEPPKIGVPLVVEMKHPILTAAGVKAVGVEELGQLEKQAGGTWVSVSKLLEYRPPTPALVKPRGSIPGPDKVPPAKAKTEADLALEQATAELLEAKAAAG